MSLVLYEDEYCLLVNKPNNVVVHHAYHSRNVRDEDSLLLMIKNELGMDVFPVHRLDRKTSGIVLLAKQTAFVSKFQELFTTNDIKKEYYGLVRGFASDEKTIDSPVKGRDAKEYKEALTKLKTLNRVTVPIAVKPYDTARYSLVHLTPQTGRMHQLRIHMQKISHPLIGDPKYGDNNHNQMFEKEYAITNLFLHAGSLSFEHPFTTTDMAIAAEFPNHWQKMFRTFEWENPIIVQ